MKKRDLKISNEKGVILITVLILTVIVTLIGVIAITNSAVDIQISGNMRRATTAFEGAEAGIDLGVSVIENTIANASLTPTSTGNGITTLDTANLQTEILGGSDNNPDTPQASADIGMNNLGGVAVNSDIDRLYSYINSGGASQFAMGYEGIGAGAAGGGTVVLYKIDSQGM